MKNTSLPRRCPFGQSKRAAFLIIGLAGALALLKESRAQTTSSWISETITTGGTVTWSTGGKWTPAAPVTTNGTVNLNFGSLTATTTALTLQNNIGAFNIYQMTLANANGVGVTYSRSSGANTYTFVKDGSGNNPQLISNGAGGSTQTLNFSPIIAAGAVLEITGTSTGAIVNNTVISGGGGMNYNKAGGTWTASGVNTFSGDFTLTQGTVALGANSTGTPGSVTNGPLGTGTVILNGGTLRAVSTVQATVGNNIQIAGDFTVGAASGNKNVTLTGTTLLTGTGVTRTITGGFAGAAAADTNTLTFSGAIADGGGGNGITFTNTADTRIVLSGVNTFTGNTTVTGGNLTLSDNAELKFVIGGNGVNNQLTGNGTVTLNGDFRFDLTGAGTTLGNSWNIVNVGSLTETFGATFSVVDFSDLGGNVWEKVNGGRTYQFSEATGILSVTAVPEPATWVLVAAGLTVGVIFRRRRSL